MPALRKRVASVCVLSSTVELGGVERHILALTNRLVARRFHVTLVVLGRNVFRDRLELHRGVEVLESPTSRPFARIAWREASQIMRNLPGDACIFEKGSFDTGSFALDLAARIRFRRYITVEQLQAEPLPPKTTRRHFGGLVPGVGWWWYKLRLWGHLRSWAPHKVVCVSDAVRNTLLQQYWFPRRKAVTVYNGIDLTRFAPNPAFREEVRQELGIPASALVLGAIARFHPVKNLDMAMRCFVRLAAELPERDLHLVFFGQGSEEQRLKAMAASSPVSGRIHFRPFTTEPWKVLNALDVFVMPSRNEGLPFALLEAMATGCCPIATRVAGNAEVVQTPDVGWLVDLDEDAFLSAMRASTLMTDQQRAAMGRAARELVVRQFDEARQLDTIIDLLLA
jgi:glycosyltransferase involved in cell wall biosynthesis